MSSHRARPCQGNYLPCFYLSCPNPSSLYPRIITQVAKYGIWTWQVHQKPGGGGVVRARDATLKSFARAESQLALTTSLETSPWGIERRRWVLHWGWRGSGQGASNRGNHPGQLGPGSAPPRLDVHVIRSAPGRGEGPAGAGPPRPRHRQLPAPGPRDARRRPLAGPEGGRPLHVRAL